MSVVVGNTHYKPVDWFTVYLVEDQGNYIYIHFIYWVDKQYSCGSVVAEQLRAPNSNSGVSDQQSVGSNPPVVTLVSLSKTLDHCFILRMERNAVGPMCCVTHVK